MSAHSFQPVVLRGKHMGQIRDLEYWIFRDSATIWRSSLCRIHNVACPALTVSTEAIQVARQQGAVFVHAQVRDADGLHHYVTNVSTLEQAGRTDDSEGYPQYTLPLHQWVRLPD